MKSNMERFTNRNYKNTTLALESCKPYLRLGHIEDIEEEMGLSVEEMAIICKIVNNNYIYINEYGLFPIWKLRFDFENRDIIINVSYKDAYDESHWEQLKFKITDYKKKYYLKEDKSK